MLSVVLPSIVPKVTHGIAWLLPPFSSPSHVSSWTSSAIEHPAGLRISRHIAHFPRISWTDVGTLYRFVSRIPSGLRSRVRSYKVPSTRRRKGTLPYQACLLSGPTTRYIRMPPTSRSLNGPRFLACSSVLGIRCSASPLLAGVPPSFHRYLL